MGDIRPTTSLSVKFAQGNLRPCHQHRPSATRAPPSFSPSLPHPEDTDVLARGYQSPREIVWLLETQLALGTPGPRRRGRSGADSGPGLQRLPLEQTGGPLASWANLRPEGKRACVKVWTMCTRALVHHMVCGHM